MTTTQDGEKEMVDSWLVQRLERPWGRALGAAADNPFSFGGGLHNGGLSDQAMGLLRDIFSFDYMGAAEFEWGAVHAALRAIASRADRLVAFSFTIPLRNVEKHWRDRSKTEPDGAATVYVMCDQAWQEEVERRIRLWASRDLGARLKEPTMLANALRPVDDFDERHCGWLELDNGFFFFADEAMWQATADLFGATTRSGSSR